MSQGYAALTQKEKQTLRLIVRGHDAKSIARHLGLSVHTVNERLRDARRKMAVSSSREAARRVFEAEGDSPAFLAPDLVGDNGLGEAANRNEAQPSATPRTTRRGLVWASTGVVIMSLILAALALSSSPPVMAPSSASATASATVAESPDPAGKAAIDAARGFLALVDAGDWSRSYAATAQTFRKNNSEALWAESSRQVYPPLGALRDRTLAAADFVPARPDGAWIVKFRSSFANRKNAIETLALERDDGTWKVTGIFVD